MAGTPGKNKLSRGTRFTAFSQDLSADLVPGSLNGFGFVAGFVDLTGESDAVGNGLADRKQVTLKAKFHLNDTGTTGAHTVLSNSVGSTTTVTIDVGSSGAAPSTGDPEFGGTFVLLKADVSPNGGKMEIDTEWRPATSTAPAWTTKA